MKGASNEALESPGSTGAKAQTSDGFLAVKTPPPEPAKDIHVRSLVIFAFWAIVIFLGLPVWWWTTSIHRSRLPLQEMLEWADGKACRPTFPLQIVVDAPALPESDAQNLVRTIQHALDDLNEFSAHHLRLNLGDSMALAKPTADKNKNSNNTRGESLFAPHIRRDEVALTIKLSPAEGIQSPAAELRPHSTVLDVSYPSNQSPSTLSTSSILANVVASRLQGLFAEEQASIAYILMTNQPSGHSQHSSNGNSHATQASLSASSPREQRPGRSRTLSPELADKLARRTTRSLKYAPTYHITISLFTPTSVPSLWDIESAVEEYLAPLLNSFTISNFTVDTQVQLYATFSPSVQHPEFDENLRAWTLRTEDLSGFINAAEWPLSPSIGAGPTLNFVLYVPDAKMAPLMVKESHATSWLIPQWGGVTILNPQKPELGTPQPVQSLTKDAIRPALLTFSHQLLLLLGAPDTPPSFPLQLQTLTRVRAASLLFSASSTMGSLARLTVALPSIAIPENVAVAVDRTLSHLRETCSSLRDGKFNEALKHARVAEAEAERGFFDKSMVGQVYFPDEHKVAVYLPLLGPIGVPLVMSALKDIRRLRTVYRLR
ncbi:GPI transamidase component [Trapelia coarctata]|nr:GPI transamidase component [Trapelia coarctata]